MNFDFTNPYTSTRIPVFARNVVSTSHPLAAQAGLRMLLKGGNAVDAAVAAAAAITICEPVSNGLGSDAFCILWDGRELHGLNASGRAPQAWTPAYFKSKYGDSPSLPKRGMDTVTVPGAVASWVALSERFGKLPFADLMEPAIEIAERGYLLPPVVQQKWAAATDELKNQPGFAQSFLPWGRAPRIGEPFEFKAAAKGLRKIAESRGQAFYGGEIAQAIEKFSAAHGGSITAADFASYQPEWSKPISKSYRGFDLHEIGPNGQGIAALIALGILGHFDMASQTTSGENCNIGMVSLCSISRGTRKSCTRWSTLPDVTRIAIVSTVKMPMSPTASSRLLGDGRDPATSASTAATTSNNAMPL